MTNESRAKKWCLDLVDDHVYVMKNGSRLCIEGGPTSGELYGSVTGVNKTTAKDGRDLIKFKFSHGSSRGFSLKAFDWQSTEFSNKFHTKGVNTIDSFLECLTTLSNSHSLQPLSTTLNQSESTTMESRSVASLSTGNRKRKADSMESSPRSLPPALRALKVVSQSEPSSNSSHTSNDSDSTSDVDKDIQRCFVGYFELPVSLLVEPARSRLLRKVDKDFVKRLKDAMLENPSSDSAPIVGQVLLKDGEEFDPTKSHTYEYEAIGGNNSRQALQELNRECEDPLYRTRLVSVYKGLSDQQARRLASKHNHATSLHHNMTTWDKVELCRMMLFELSGIEDGEEVPSKKPDNWRAKCSEILMMKVRPLDDASIFFLAGLQKEVYTLVKRIFSHYSLCQLKGQTAKRGSVGQRLDLKGNNFKPLRGLEMEVVKEVLKEVANKKMTLQEMSHHCNKTKQLVQVQKCFVEATGLTSWEEATEKLPVFTTVEALDEFTSIKKFSSTDRFNQYCRAALRSLEYPTEKIELGMYSLNNYSVCISNNHSHTFASLKEHTGQALDPFTGFMCTVVHYECIQNHLDTIIRQVRSINTVGGTNKFCVVVICELDDISMIKTTFNRCGLPTHSIGYVHHTNFPSVVNSSSMFQKQTSLMIVGSTDCSHQSNLCSDLFTSESRVVLKDDDGKKAGKEDFSADFYESLFQALTNASDWVFLPHIQSVSGLIGGLLAERNVVGSVSDVLHPLIKRSMIKNLDKMKEEVETEEERS